MTDLREYKKNVYSQCGEDGILERVLNIIGDNNQWCVEFGAWDAQYMSNTFNLIKNKGYSAVLIEADKHKFKELVKNTRSYPNVTPINAYVGWNAEQKLDEILKRTSIPVDFDLLSIDVDGNDYHIWNAVKEYRPKVVVIEFNQTIPSHLEFIQKAHKSVNIGSSIRSIYNLGKQKNYELVCTTDFNAIFVEQRYYELFQIEDNDPETLIKNSRYYTYLFQGLNGQIFLSGCKKLLWHNIPFAESKIQQIPKYFRYHPKNFSYIKKVLFKLYSILRKNVFK